MSAGSHKSIVVASCETGGPVGAVPLWFCSVSSRPHFLTKPAEHVLIQVAVSNGKTFRKCLEKAPWRTQRVIKIFRTWLWLSGWRRKWQPTPVFLPGESQGWGAWWAAICGVAQSWTRLKRLSSSRSSGSGVKILPADAGDAGGKGSVPGSGRPPGVMTTHSSILTQEIPWTEEPGGLQFMGLKEWDTTGWLSTDTCTYPR